jgi:protein ImuA
LTVARPEIRTKKEHDLPMTHHNAATIARLRDRIWALEQGTDAPPPVQPIGVPDSVLPWGGLPLARIHQIALADRSGLGFAAGLLGLVARGRTVLWCRRRDTAIPFLPGLTPFGLDTAQVLTVEAERATELLWAIEEGLRCPALGAVLGEIDDLPLPAARRLQLAAETGQVAGLIVTPERAMAGGATTRWRVTTAPSPTTPWGGLGAPAWHVSLERCRNGLPRSWTLAWRDGQFALLES